MLDHRSHLPHGDLDTASAAGHASAHSAVLAALALALSTDDVAGEREFGRLSAVQIFERDVDAMYEIFGFARLPRRGPASAAKATETASAEELTEQILKCGLEKKVTSVARQHTWGSIPPPLSLSPASPLASYTWRLSGSERTS